MTEKTKKHKRKMTDGGEVEKSDEDIEELLEENEQLKQRLESFEEDYAEEKPSFEDRKQNTKGLAKLSYEYLERSKAENKRVRQQKNYKEVSLQPLWPHEMVRNLSIAAFFTGMMILVAALLPPHIDAPANLSETPFIILPDWYLYWSFGLLKLGPINPNIAFLGGQKIVSDRVFGVVANIVVVGVLLILPFINPGKARRPVEEPFWASIGVGGVIFAFTISVLAVQNIVTEFSILGFSLSSSLLFDLTFILPILAALITYPILKAFQQGYMYDLNRRYYRLR